MQENKELYENLKIEKIKNRKYRNIKWQCYKKSMKRGWSYMGSIESNTPYDDVCRTMVVECDDLVIPLINEMFGEHFRPGDRILRLANEHFIEQQGGAEEKRITDGLVSIFDPEENREKRYHIECESGRGSNGTILIRIFEYAAQIALDDGKVWEDTLRVDFPRSAVIFLRKKNEAVNKLTVCLNTQTSFEDIL